MQEIVEQFNDFDSAASAYVADNDDESATPVPLQKRKPRAKRAKQSALDEQALATGSRMYKGPLSDAAQQVSRGGNPCTAWFGGPLTIVVLAGTTSTGRQVEDSDGHRHHGPRFRDRRLGCIVCRRARLKRASAHNESIYMILTLMSGGRRET